MIRKRRFHGLAGALTACANSFCPGGGAACVMIPSCKNSRPAEGHWSLYLRRIQTVAPGSVCHKKAAHSGVEFVNCPLDSGNAFSWKKFPEAFFLPCWNLHAGTNSFFIRGLCNFHGLLRRSACAGLFSFS